MSFFTLVPQVMNSAIAQFCLEVIARHGDPAPRLCNKDPLTLKLGSYVIELFPNVGRLPEPRAIMFVCANSTPALPFYPP